MTKVSKVATDKPPITSVANAALTKRKKNFVRMDKAKQEKSISCKRFCLERELLEKDN